MSDLESIANQVADALAPLRTDEFRRSIRGLPKRLREQADDLAAHGWTIPLYSTPREVDEILALRTSAAVEEYFVGYYTRSDAKNLHRLRRDLLIYQSLRLWRRLLEQCFSAYEREDYLVTIPSLLSILEGVVVGLTNKAGKVNIVQAIRDREKAAPEESILRVIWYSSRVFTEHIFRSHDFRRERPTVLNRHWILHGRDVPDWGAADSLRLLQALHFLGRAKAL